MTPIKNSLIVGFIIFPACAFSLWVGLCIGENFDGNMNNGGSIHITVDK